jgi:hypothetical protein
MANVLIYKCCYHQVAFRSASRKERYERHLGKEKKSVVRDDTRNKSSIVEFQRVFLTSKLKYQSGKISNGPI